MDIEVDYHDLTLVAQELKLILFYYNNKTSNTAA